MRSAPSVNYPVGRSRYAERLLLTIWILGACCAIAVCWRFDGSYWRESASMLSVAATGVLARIGSLRSAAVASLSFDGRYWTVWGRRIPGKSGKSRASVAVDLQSLLLVRVAEPGGPRHWLWLERRAMPARWRDLRRALYSRAPAPDSLHPAPAGAHRHFS